MKVVKIVCYLSMQKHAKQCEITVTFSAYVVSWYSSLYPVTMLHRSVIYLLLVCFGLYILRTAVQNRLGNVVSYEQVEPDVYTSKVSITSVRCFYVLFFIFDFYAYTFSRYSQFFIQLQFRKCHNSTSLPLNEVNYE